MIKCAPYDTPTNESPYSFLNYGPDSYSNNPSHVVETSRSQTAEELFSQYLSRSTISCSIPGGCQTPVGKILGASDRLEANNGTLGTGTTVCTGFLVDTDIVATNSHCIPEEVKSGRTHCSKLIAFQTAFEQPILCKEVMTFSPLVRGQITGVNDYSFIRIEKPILTVAPLQIDTTGVSENEEVIIKRFSPGTGYSGTMEQLTCPITRYTLIAKSHHERINLDEVLGGCNLVHGNSGSPALNSSGKVVGIIKATLGAGEIRELMRLFPMFHIRNPRTLIAMDSTACIPFGALTTLPTECSSNPALAQAMSEQRTQEQLKALITQLTPPSALQTIEENSFAKWTNEKPISIDSAPGPFTFVIQPLTPRCLRPPSDWRFLQRRRYGRGHVAETVTLPTYTFEYVLNEYAQLVFIQVGSVMHQEYDVTYGNLQSTTDSQYTISNYDNVIGTETIPLCAK